MASHLDALTGASEADPMRRGTLGDPARAAAVHRILRVDDRPPGLRSTAELAAELLSAPYARACLVGDGVLVSGLASQEALQVVEGSLDPDDPDAAVLAAAAPVPAVTHLGVPLVGEAGHVLGTLCVEDVRDRSWTPRQTAALEQLAAGLTAELELRAVTAELRERTARLDLALDAARIGSFALTLSTSDLRWDERLIELFGYQPEEFVPHLDTFWARVHPDDRQQVDRRIAAAVAARDTFSAEYRVVLPGGGVRWIAARGRVVVGADGEDRLLGAALDVTDSRAAEERAARVLETMGDAFISVDRGWRFTYVNQEAERLLGRSRDDLVGKDLWQEFPAAAQPTSGFWRHFRAAMGSGEPLRFEEHYPAPLDAWYEVSVWPAPGGLSVYFHEVTERRRVEEERTVAIERLERLGQVTRALVSTLDTDEALDRLARLTVPWLGDWTSIALLDDHGHMRISVARHRDPAKQPTMARFSQLQVSATTADSISATVARTRQPVLRSTISVPEVRQHYRGDELTEVLEQLGFSTLLAVPLESRGRVLGVILLVGDPDRRPFDEDDLATAVELAQRAGLAVDNAQLYGQQRTFAETMQRSLLTTAPEPDHLEIAVRYLPAARESSVGGDWHDAHLQPDGATVLSIGDVMGHDVDAAAAMAQIRTLLRGISVTSEGSPAQVLASVDAAMEVLEVGTLATAVVVRVEQSGTDRASGRRRLVWSNAGHPPPMLLRADGTVEVLHRERDLLLGLDPQTERHDHVVALEPGDAVLLHTDGLVERRGTPLAIGLHQLASALQGRAHLPLEELCDELLERMLPDDREDDVAVVALRTHPEDRPRPPGAGPAHVPPGVS